MGKRLFLHVGLPKTGTSAVQKWLRENRAALLEAGISYPETYGPHDDKHSYLVGLLLTGRDPAAFAADLTRDGAGTVLFSNEGLSNHLYDFAPGALERLRALTARMDTEVLVVTRAPEAWLVSYHRQCVLGPINGASELWGTGLTREEIRSHPRILALLARARLEDDLAAAYGAARVTALTYDDPGWFGGFLDRLGAGHLRDRPLPHVNESLPDWMVEMLRQINAMALGRRSWRAWRQAVQRHLKSRNILLLAAASAPPEPADPAVLDRIQPPDGWSATDLAAYTAFATEIRAAGKE